MNIDVQYKVNSSPNLKKYLRENSFWYKHLNRDPKNLEIMSNEMRERYKLRLEDKFEQFLEKIHLIQSFFEILK